MSEMPHPVTIELEQSSIHFLEQSSPVRFAVLREQGLARYAPILGQMPLTKANIACVMRFFQYPNRVKFPDLRDAELAGLSLDGVNFIRADLSGANLRGCRLQKVDLVFVRLVKTDLRDADLRGATLNETLWSGTLVKGCQMGQGIGLTKRQKQELQAGGALLDEGG
jgi:Pentapeptide repeats (8 copies)